MKTVGPLQYNIELITQCIVAMQTNSYPAIQENPYTVWNLQVYYCHHSTLPLVPIHSQVNPVHTHPSHFFKIHIKNILPCMPRSSK